MRIALLVVLAFAGLWFAALRPKPVDVPAAPPTPAPQAAAPEPTPAPTAAAPKPTAVAPKPAAAAARTATAEQPAAVRRVLADLDARRTTVLLFWDRRVADDREVRRVVAGVDRRGGRVKVHVLPISKVGDFEAITRDVPVATSPTVLVIGRDRRARVVEGLTVGGQLDELVAEALGGR